MVGNFWAVFPYSGTMLLFSIQQPDHELLPALNNMVKEKKATFTKSIRIHENIQDTCHLLRQVSFGTGSFSDTFHQIHQSGSLKFESTTKNRDLI